MSQTGQIQELHRRGLSLQWSVLPWSDQFGADPNYDTLVLELTSAQGTKISNMLPIKARGAVITKESEQARRDQLIAWAEEITRHGIPEAKHEVPDAAPENQGGEHVEEGVSPNDPGTGPSQTDRAF